MHSPAGQLPGTREPVLVCGAGAAGMAAALAAAASGAEVVLVEASRRIGGTVVAALIHTLAGLYDSSGQLINDGLPRQLVDRLIQADRRVVPRKIGRAWVLNVCPRIYEASVEGWIASMPQIRVRLGTHVAEVRREGEWVTEVELVGPDGPLWLSPRAVIDATGTAEVIRTIDSMLVEAGPPSSAGGLIFRMRGVPPDAMKFPRSVAIVRAVREAVAGGRLPPASAHAWFDQGFYDDEAFVKLLVPLAADWRERRREIEREARHVQDCLVAFLTTLPGCRHSYVAQCGEIGVREGGRIRGRYRLTGEDVRSLRRFPDAACRCAWPIEYWHPDRGIALEYLPQGSYYEVPMRCLRPQSLANVWAAGKCLSADAYAQASARVVGCCWAMGQAVGRAAAASF